MKVNAEWKEKALVLHLSGSLTAQNSDGLVAQMKSYLKPDCRCCVLESAALQQLDSAGVGALVSCLNLAKQSGIPLVIAGLAGRPLQTLQVAKADRFFTLHAGLEEALA